MFFLFFNCYRKKIIEIFFLRISIFFFISKIIALKIHVNWLYWSLIFAILTCFITKKTKFEIFLWFFTSFRIYFFFENFWKANATDCLNFLTRISHQWSAFSSKNRKIFFFKSLKFFVYQIWTVSRKHVKRLIRIVSVSYMMTAFFYSFHEHENISIVDVSIHLNDVVSFIRFFELEIEKTHVCDFEITFWRNVCSENVGFFDYVLSKNRKHKYNYCLNVFFRQIDEKI